MSFVSLLYLKEEVRVSSVYPVCLQGVHSGMCTLRQDCPTCLYMSLRIFVQLGCFAASPVLHTLNAGIPVL